MTLLARTTARRRLTATVENRARVKRVERRADEIASVGEIEKDYQRADRKGDLAIESRFQELYRLVDTERERAAVAAAYAVWMRSERAEDTAVRKSVAGSVDMLRENNPVWLHGTYVPDGSDGAA